LKKRTNGSVRYCQYTSVSRCLRVSRAHLHVILRRTADWKDGRSSRHTDDTDVLLRIHHIIGELPTYGYRRVWALLRRQAELDGMPAINAKRENLAEAFEHYNEWHPHSALGYRSPREYLRQQASNGLSDNRCLEI
ncbi:TPA: transposase, partial [Escherichia coli]|nr:transposase [Escherichia coli]